MSNGDYNPNSVDSVLSSIKTTLESHVADTAQYRKSLDARIAAVEEKAVGVERDFKEHKNRVFTFATIIGGASGHAGGWLQKFFGGN